MCCGWPWSCWTGIIAFFVWSVNGVIHAKENRPNILLVVADDQSPDDLKLYNARSELDTPSIDRLAANGMVLEGAYHAGSFSGAVCLPSRTMIMTGRTLWHLPNAPLASVHCPSNIDQFTLPNVFNQAGYATMRTCKLGNSYEPANKLFQVRHDATKRGVAPDEGSPWHADRVIDFLKARESSGDVRPFLIYLGFSHPHDPRDGPSHLLAKYGATNHTDELSPPVTNARQPKLPINYLPAHPFDTSHSNVRDEVAVSGVWNRRDEGSIRNEIGRQFACSELIDQQVGRILDILKATNQLQNTYVFYTSDHGMAIGRHGLMGKQNLYQHTWRVPFIVAGPGIPPGSRAEGNIYLMDLLATLCDLCGIAAPATNEGVSFRGVLEGTLPTIRQVLFGVYAGGSQPGIRCVKHENWKLIRYEAADRGLMETQLFDLDSNPNELMEQHQAENVRELTGNTPLPLQRNLAGDPEYRAQLEYLQSLLDQQMAIGHDPAAK